MAGGKQKKQEAIIRKEIEQVGAMLKIILFFHLKIIMFFVELKITVLLLFIFFVAAEKGEGSGEGEDEHHLQGVGRVCQGADGGTIHLKMYSSKSISQNVFLKMCFLKCISQNVFL